MIWFSKKRLEWNAKFWKFRRICKELRVMFQSGSKEMKRAIKVATRAGFRRFSRIHSWVVSLHRGGKQNKRRMNLPMPADLSSLKFQSRIDEFLEEFDDLSDPLPDFQPNFPMNTLEESRDGHNLSAHHHHTQNAPLSHQHHSPSKLSHGDLEGNNLESKSQQTLLSTPTALQPPLLRRANSCNPQTSPSPPSSLVGGKARTPGNTRTGFRKYFPVRRHSESSLSSGHPASISSRSSESEDRSIPSETEKSSKCSADQLSLAYARPDEQQVLFKKNSVLEFIFEEPSTQSTFLRTQALQNILECPSCRDMISIKRDGDSKNISEKPKDSCKTYQGYLDASKCLLCECSYGETKSLLLEKLTAAKWFRPCRYQSFGCQSLVGHTLSNDIHHNEDECKFQPLHCPYMLCPKKLQTGALLKHLTAEHNLHPHQGPKSDGSISFLTRNRRLGSLRPDYALDPCMLLCYDHIFVFRLLRHSSSWYFWVWSFKPTSLSSPSHENYYHKCSSRSNHFPFTIRFRRQLSSASDSKLSPDSLTTELTVTGMSVPLAITTEELFEKNLCEAVPEPGSVFDTCGESSGSLTIDYTLVIHPPTPTPHRTSHGHHRRRLNSKSHSRNNLSFSYF